MKYIIFIILFIILSISVTGLVLINKFSKKKEYFTNNEIPKVIVSTYHNKNKIPLKVYENIREMAPNYKFVIFDDNEIIDFLKQNYPPRILNTFLELEKGPHKADLFRYCYLYKYGGIYIDIKTELIKNIDEIFNKKNINLYTVISTFGNTIHQGVIASKPNNPIFKALINYIIEIPKPVYRYFAFTIDFYNKLKKYYYLNELKPGYNKNGLYLFKEKCNRNSEDCYDGLDKYGRCCFIYENNKQVIKTRYADYPW